MAGARAVSFLDHFPRDGARVRLTAGDGAGRLAICLSDGEPIGSIIWRVEGWELLVDGLVVEAERRGFGHGLDAVGVLLAAAEAAGFERLRAWAPPHLGLAVYFWFRAGLHPLHGPGPNGGIWLQRDLVGAPTAVAEA